MLLIVLAVVLLFSGAVSIGFCRWQTGAAEWTAVHWLALLQDAHWVVLVMGVAAFVLVMTNFIMNVAAIAIVLPVAPVIAKYRVVARDVMRATGLHNLVGQHNIFLAAHKALARDL